MPAEAQRFDLIVIGAGINGAAIAREAALRDQRVLLMERADLAVGTTAASTRLIHGGLRYLEHREFGLVYESLAERERLLHTAPHLVAPLEFCLPIYRRGHRSRWLIRAGLTVYDLLSMRKSLPRHRMLSAAAVRDRLPGVESAGLAGGASYYDAQAAFPERLVIENVKDAVSNGCMLLTHTEVVEVLVDNATVQGVRWRDASGGTGRFLSDLVVNAAGPWVDRVIGKLGSSRLVGGTRGSHLIVDDFSGAPRVAVYTEAATDARPFFIVPWNGRYLIGTTDERFDGDPSDAVMTAAEYRYLVDETRNLFPSAGDIGPKVRYTHCGVRPLPYVPRGSASAITRRHLIRHHRNARGLYSVVGGKLTTHRALAVDVMRRLRRRKRAIPKGSSTDTRMLPGALAPSDRDELIREAAATTSELQARRLWSIYGAATADIIAYMRRDSDLAMVVAPQARMLVGELVHALDSEWAVDLEDVVQRRSMAGFEADCGLTTALGVAQWMVRLGYCDHVGAAEQLRNFRHRIRRFRVPWPI